MCFNYIFIVTSQTEQNIYISVAVLLQAPEHIFLKAV